MHRQFPDIADLDLDIPDELKPSAMRRMGLTPPLDQMIDNLAPPAAPFWRQWAVALLRGYRRVRPAAIGNRCVFEPSCSRYSELAFRTRRFPDAVRLTLGRLHKCRPGNGGTDLHALEMPE